ncbi:MAG TPA: metallophosphoesterase [Thermoleophilaceae bacterium]
MRQWLLDALEGVDQVVLLGDTIELRDGPAARAVAEARPLFAELADIVGGRIVLVPGNHDHQLAGALLHRGYERLGRQQLASADERRCSARSRQRHRARS